MQARIVLSCVAAVGFAIMLYASEPKIVKPSYNKISEEEEAIIGRNAVEMIDQELPILNDPLLNRYLSDLGKQVARESRRPSLTYTFKIVNTREVNAFAVPGGHIYFYRGLLEFVETEGELVGILGHEVGHIVGYHGTNALSRHRLLLRAIERGRQSGALTDERAQEVLLALGGPIVLFVDRKFSRHEETQADRLAVYNVARAGHNPEGLMTMFERLQQYEGNPGILDRLLSSHPMSKERIETVRKELPEVPGKDYKDDSIGFKAAKVRLSMLPPEPDREDE